MTKNIKILGFLALLMVEYQGTLEAGICPFNGSTYCSRCMWGQPLLENKGWGVSRTCPDFRGNPIFTVLGHSKEACENNWAQYCEKYDKSLN
jgi:hypothetical protein